LLDNESLLDFIGTNEYLKHKQIRFSKADFEIPIAENDAFLLKNLKLRGAYKKRYKSTGSLYYKGLPGFEVVLARIAKFLDKL
tara:strand:- start:806 stop:1054 length:249 start_codon:yes stop_codon:yes gene_type:complete